MESILRLLRLSIGDLAIHVKVDIRRDQPFTTTGYHTRAEFLALSLSRLGTLLVASFRPSQGGSATVGIPFLTLTPICFQIQLAMHG